MPPIALLLSLSLALPATPQLGSLADVRTGAEAGEAFASALAGADVNGDGFEDLLVGSPGADTPRWKAGKVTLWLGSPAGLAPAPAWEVFGDRTGARLGSTLARAGDVNGDGFEDVLVGAPERVSGNRPWHTLSTRPSSLANAGLGEGEVRLYLGSPTGLAATPQRILRGPDPGERFGAALAGVGDVNGDGFDDVLVGAPGKDAGRGLVLLFLGSAAGLGPTPDVLKFGTTPGAAFGSAVSGAGDANGDGFADFAVGEPWFSSSQGRVVRYLGHASTPGLQDLVRTLDRSAGSSLTLTDVTGDPQVVYGAPWSPIGTIHRGHAGLLETSYTLTPSYQDATRFGEVVVGSNVEGDADHGHAVSAPGYLQADGQAHGRVYVFGAVHDPVPLFVLDPPRADLRRWGAGLTALDLDGDGADEIVVGTPDWAETSPGQGSLHVYRGARPSLTEETAWTMDLPVGTRLHTIGGDIDGDGFDDALLRDSAETLLLVRGTAQGPTPPTPLAFQIGTVLPAPAANEFVQWDEGYLFDADGDGIDDLVIHASLWACGTSYCGAAQSVIALVKGGASGLAATPLWTLPRDGSQSGMWSVGDVNGDGRGDLLLRYISHPTLGTLVGEVWAGTSTGMSLLPLTIPLGDEVLATHGDWNGDGLADLVVRDGYDFDVHVGTLDGFVFSHTTSLPMHTVNQRKPDLLPWLMDVDGDGLDDLVVNFDLERQLFEPGNLEVFWLSGAGGLSTIEAWTSGQTRSGFAVPDAASRLVRDWDGDGREDLLLLTSPYLGLPDPYHTRLFLAGSTIPCSSDAPTGRLGLADVDGDGEPELLLNRPDVLRFYRWNP